MAIPDYAWKEAPVSEEVKFIRGNGGASVSAGVESRLRNRPLLWLAAAGLGLLSAFVGVRWLARDRAAPPLVRALYLVFAVGAIFACLEEISYGQHFIGWQSPRWFDQANAQHETNLHNLLQDRPGKLLRNGSLVAVALGGIILPAAATWMGGQYTAGRWAYYLLPRAELVPLVTASLIMRLVRTLPHDLRSGRDTALFEVLELYLAITDDGIGGARINEQSDLLGRGSGLHGMLHRVQAIDGQMELESPIGGPTTLEVMLPCG